jgi:hypothetical protein
MADLRSRGAGFDRAEWLEAVAAGLAAVDVEW